MSGVVLVAFLLAIYLPQTFFRLWAERYVDLGRKEASQFDQIVGPILPSLMLHVQTWLVIHGICLVLNLVGVTAWNRRWSFPGVDWHLLLTFSNESAARQVSAILSDWYTLMWPVAYVVALALVTFINGVAYGRGTLIGLYAKADPVLYPKARVRAWPPGWWRRLRTIHLPALIFWGWKLVFQEYIMHTFFPWGELKPFVFVKVKDGSLFHGRFEGYEKNRLGEVDMILLKQASRFTRRPIRDALKDGEHPLRPLRGVLALKWSEVADINTTTPTEIQRLYMRWENIRAKGQKPQV